MWWPVCSTDTMLDDDDKLAQRALALGPQRVQSVQLALRECRIGAVRRGVMTVIGMSPSDVMARDPIERREHVEPLRIKRRVVHDGAARFVGSDRAHRGRPSRRACVDEHQSLHLVGVLRCERHSLCSTEGVAEHDIGPRFAGSGEQLVEVSDLSVERLRRGRRVARPGAEPCRPHRRHRAR